MASGQIAGNYFLAAGNPQRYREFARGRSDVFDNAAGSNPYYLAPGGNAELAGKPFDDGVILKVPVAPVAGPGEAFYSGVVSTTQDGVDSDDVSMTVNFEGTIATIENAVKDAQGRIVGGRVVSERPFFASAVGDRITSTEDVVLGLPDDPFVNVGIPALTHCWCVLGPNEYLFLRGRAQLDVRDDTA